MEELWVKAHLFLQVSLRTGGGNSGSYIPLSFCANLLVHQHYSDITARDLVECQSTSSAWHAVKDLNPRRRRSVAYRTIRTMLTAYKSSWLAAFLYIRRDLITPCQLLPRTDQQIDGCVLVAAVKKTPPFAAKPSVEIFLQPVRPRLTSLHCTWETHATFDGMWDLWRSWRDSDPRPPP